MTRLLALLLALLLAWPVNAQPMSDVCHVYVLAVGKKLFVAGLECDCNAKREKVKR
jgi:hypothetical protein